MRRAHFQDGGAALCRGEVAEDAALEPAKHCLIQVLRPVGGSQYYHPVASKAPPPARNPKSGHAQDGLLNTTPLMASSLQQAFALPHKIGSC